MNDEIDLLDEEFTARLEGQRVDPRASREYWDRLRAIYEKKQEKELVSAVDKAVNDVFGHRGIYVQSLGKGYYWLRPRADRGLEFRFLLELEKKLPQGIGIKRLLEKHHGFVITVG